MTPGDGDKRYVVVCRGPHCRARGSLPLRRRLVALLRGRADLGLIGYACFGQCDHGPNVALYPDGVWYGGLREKDAADRLVRHLTSGEPLTWTPLQVAPEERAAHMKNVGDLVTTQERDEQRRSRAGRRRWLWWPFRSQATSP